MENLIENIGHLSSVYLKKPEDFVKRLKDSANARIDDDFADLDDIMAKNPAEEKTEFFQEQNVSYANKDDKLAANTPSNLIDVVSQPPQEP